MDPRRNARPAHESDWSPGRAGRAADLSADFSDLEDAFDERGSDERRWSRDDDDRHGSPERPAWQRERRRRRRR